MALSAKLLSRCERDPKTGCLVWMGARTGAGYGASEQKSTHRLSWEQAYGPIPEGLLVCHKCDNRPCIEPTHLFLGTPGDNTQDCRDKGRANLPFGARHWAVKIRTPEVEEIRRLWATREHTQQALADRFGVHQPQICRIVNRSSRSHE